MSLPFIKPQRQQSGIATDYRKPDEGKEPSNQDHAMEAVAKDLLDAFKSDNIRLLAKALRSAFEIADSEPHEEGPHLNETEEE